MTPDSSGYPGAPPGWYPDPAGGPGQRWWDGYAWTEAVVLPEPPHPPLTGPSPVGRPPPHLPPDWVQGPAGWQPTAPPGYPPAPGAYPGRLPSGAGFAPPSTSWLVDLEVRQSRLARVAVAFPALNFVLWAIFIRVYSSQLTNIGNQIRVISNDQANGITAPNLNIPTFSGALPFLVEVADLGAIAAVVIACIWQFRAASAARSLGYPSTHSPGWGVGSWFVPLVNFWMPYQAVRDCLPPGDGRRAIVRWWWAFLLIGLVAMEAALVSSLFSSGAGLVLSVIGVVCGAGIAGTAPRVVDAITHAHQQTPVS
ncbi:MAG TPA: DUF4328 domain-containing protein [Acidimicrobiales bacterium]|nr:DUF4328 domain-containing protein [Acidimicrobiales bacterium]